MSINMTDLFYAVALIVSPIVVALAAVLVVNFIVVDRRLASAREAFRRWRLRRRVRWYVRRLRWSAVETAATLDRATSGIIDQFGRPLPSPWTVSADAAARRLERDILARGGDPIASAGDRESGPVLCDCEDPECGADDFAAAPQRTVAALPRARTLAAPGNLRGRDGRRARAMTAVLGACAGAMLTVAWLHPLPSEVFSGHHSLYQAPTASFLDIPNAKFGQKRLPLVVGTELPGLPGLRRVVSNWNAVFAPSGSPVPRATREHGSRLHGSLPHGLPVLGGNLPVGGGRGKAKYSGVVNALHPLVTYFTYRYKYSYYREYTHIRVPPDEGVCVNVDPYRGYIYREKAVNPVNHTYPPVIVRDFSGNSSSELPVTRSEGVSSGY